MNVLCTAGPLVVFALAATSLTGCIYEDERPRRLAPEPYSTAGSASASGEPTPPRSPAPMLVEIDTDQTMNAIGGEGVGVFVEYSKGGRWHIWWTCDTAETRQSCDFSVSAAAVSGDITHVDASELAGGFVTTRDASRIDAKSTTTTELHGLRFDTAPGVAITLEAAVGGLKDGAFLFFVQDGKVNGGFTGKLTNPLQLQGNVP